MKFWAILIGTILIFSLLDGLAFGATLYDSMATDPQIIADNEGLRVDKQVMIVADLTNGQDREQDFAYIVQIHDQNDVIVSLSWLTGELFPGQTFSPAQSWIPKESGTYTIQIFVWESVNNPDALSAPLSLTVDVV